MHPGVNLRRPAGTAAITAPAAGALRAAGTPAGAQTGPTATLEAGTLTVTGTPARDVLLVTTGPSSVQVRGTPGVGHSTISGAEQDITVAGLTPLVTPDRPAADDFLLIQTLEGDDVVDSPGLVPGTVQLIVQ